MPLHGDSRPFVVLQQSVEDFQTGFDTDIKSCLKLFESKIASLLCDPDSLNTSSSKDGRRLSADFQFTKAKYEVFIHMKDLFDKLDSSWKEQLEEMKNSFLEEVEIFLAKTKLEVHENENKKSSTSAKNRKKPIESSAGSSLLSPLIEKAKRIPGLSSVFPDSDMDEDTEENGYSLTSIAPRKVIRPTQSSPQSHKLSTNKTPPKSAKVANTEEVDMDSDMEEDNEESVAVQEASPVKNSKRKLRQPPPQKPTPIKKATVGLTPLRNSAVRKGRKSILKADSVLESELHTTPSRSTRKRTAGKDTIPINSADEVEVEESDMEAAPKTPKNVHFSVGFDVHEDLDIYSPEVNISRSAPRRKTVVSDGNSFNDINLTPNIGRSKSKRKTIGGSAAVAPSPKRLKPENNFISTSIAEEESDLSGSESTAADNYTPWVLLDDLDGRVPAQPGIYELKVYKAKKSAYIGSCDNLRQKITLHKVGQNSGHKHLDKFLERNKKDVQVRYEKTTSAPQAKNEAMKRIKSFVELHRTTPAYN